jgi:hypothetical protein
VCQGVLVILPHAIIVAKEKAVGEYYQDTIQDISFQDIVCSTSILQEEEDEERKIGTLRRPSYRDILKKLQGYGSYVIWGWR